MYNLPEFKEQDPEQVLAFMQAHPFAMLIGATTEAMPVATQVPVLIDQRAGKLVLSGHLMRKTDHHRALEENPQALFVFTGAHAYVSATWYSDPHQASTWNYRSVHARGRMQFTDDAGLIDIMQRTSLHFENGEAASSTSFDNLPEKYRMPLLKAIVGFEVVIDDLQHVFKMSQNRDEASYRSIVAHLQEQSGEAAEVARIMEEKKSQLYGSGH